MSENYQEMWKSLGLDLKAHDGLLGVLGQAYTDVYLAQVGRPKGMDYFNFVMSEVHGLRIKELLDAKAQGRKVIGTYCVFVPEELVLAVDGVQVGLCAGAELGTAEAEKYLPRNTCALIKSFFGFTLAHVCPYVESCDLIVGETTCDGKKKAYEIFSEIKNLHVMEIPQMKKPSDRALLLSEYREFAAVLEKLTGKRITAEGLRRGITIVNEKRKAIARVMDLRRHNPAPISGLDALLINQVSFYDDPVRFTGSVNAIADELEARVKKGEGAVAKDLPRILLSGCPMAVPNWKVPHLIETGGAVVVGEESCVGMRNIRNYTDASGKTVDAMMGAIADRYFQIDCAVFSPNKERLDHIVEMAKDLKVDGVVHYALQFCTPYLVESRNVEKALEGAGIPLLKIETDYTQEDAGQLKTRLQAFFEMLK